jgi:hypothetical protein
LQQLVNSTSFINAACVRRCALRWHAQGGAPESNLMAIVAPHARRGPGRSITAVRTDRRNEGDRSFAVGRVALFGIVAARYSQHLCADFSCALFGHVDWHCCFVAIFLRRSISRQLGVDYATCWTAAVYFADRCAVDIASHLTACTDAYAA